MKHGMACLALVLATPFAQADDAPSVDVKQEPVAAGQTWTYQRVVKNSAGVSESRTIFRIAKEINGGRLVIESLPASLTGRPTVWHKGPAVDDDSCMVDFFGSGSLGILNSCSTTFSPGMDWTTENTIRGVRVLQRYEVVDTDAVTVAAGTFQAVKIIGQWEAAGLKSTRGKPIQRTTYWYAPQARAMIKVQREILNNNGAVESEVTEELERFRQNIAR